MSLEPWDVVDYNFPWGTHPGVVVSNRGRCELKPEVVILSCRTMRADTFRDAKGNEALLDEADGLDWKTLCRCDLLYTVLKSELVLRRGRVGKERRRDIGRKIIQGLALFDL